VTIRRVLENKFAFAAIVLAFALALGLNAAFGSTATKSSDSSVPGTDLIQRADGPSIPPDPWATFAFADGPSIPPDPWATFADGPSIPPDPWATFADARLLADGPSIPPDPWATFLQDERPANSPLTVG
jgi:hypothetical protein